MPPMNGLFQACCDVLRFAAGACGCTYEETSVFVNLHLQGGILWLLGVAAAVAGWRLFRRAEGRSAVLARVGLLDGAVSTVLFAWLLLHYRGGAAAAFDRCVDDLLRLSSALGVTYRELNILIFVLGFLCVLVLQIALLAALRRRGSAAPAGKEDAP